MLFNQRVARCSRAWPAFTGGLGLGRSVSAVNTLSKDSFNDANNTALTSHTPDVGPAWTALQGTLKISSHQAVPNSGVNGDGVYLDSGKSDISISSTMASSVSASNQTATCLIFRMSDTSNFWLIELDVLNGVMSLKKNVAGSISAIDTITASLSSLTQYAVKVVTFGATFKTYLNGVMIGQDTSGFNQTATKVGLYLSVSGTYQSGANWNSFLVTSP